MLAGLEIPQGTGSAVAQEDYDEASAQAQAQGLASAFATQMTGSLAGLSARADGIKAALRQATEQSHALIESTVATQVATIRSRYAAARAMVSTEIDTLRRTIESQRDTARTEIRTTVSEKLSALQQEAAHKRSEAHRIATDHETGLRNAARAEGDRADRECRNSGARARQSAASKAGACSGEADVVRDQRAAIREVGEQTAARLTELATELRTYCNNTAQESQGDFRERAEELCSSIDSTLPQAETHVRSLGDRALEQLDHGVAAAIAQVASLAQGLHGALDGNEAHAIAAAERVQTIAPQISAGATAATSQIDGFVRRVEARITTSRDEIVHHVRDIIAPDVPGIREFLDNAEEMLGGMLAEAQDDLGKAQEEITSSLAAGAQLCARDLGTITSEIDTQLAAFGTRIQAGASRVAQEMSTLTTAARQGLAQAGDSAVELVSHSYGQSVGELRTNSSTVIGEARRRIRADVDRGLETRNELMVSLPADMDKAAERIQREHERSWLEKAVAWTLNALGSLLLTLAIAALVIVVLVVLVKAGIISAAVALLIGALLLVSGVVMSYLNRAITQLEMGQEPEFWPTLGVAILDTFGLSFIYEGVTGRELLTGRELTPEEAGSRFGTGLGVLLTVIFGGRFARWVGRRVPVPRRPTYIPRPGARQPLGACFPGSTEVHGPKGRAPIESLCVGDRVFSRDERTGEQVVRTISAVHKHSTFKLVVLSLGDEVIEATPGHQFYLFEARAWVPARDLRAGAVVLGRDGDPRVILSTTERRLAEPLSVYTLSISQHHSYFVGPTGIWVHNQPEPPPPKLPEKTIYNKDGVHVRHNYGNIGRAPGTQVEHGPVHFHVEYQGKEYKLFPSGQPLQQETKPIPPRVRDVFKAERLQFRKVSKRIGRWYRWWSTRCG